MQLSVFFIRSRRLQILTGAACAVALMAGCAIAPPQVPVKPPRPAGTAQNWVGTYRGTVPCTPPASSCTSERIALTLLPSNTYELETTVQRRGKPYTLVSRGRFQWNATRTVITLASKDENARLRIGNGIVERLPGVNDDIHDINAYRGYILRKQ
ncbi:MAG: copper resistance protein NlpE N-terminal domain-containing protein [Brachymonas sp.]